MLEDEKTAAEITDQTVDVWPREKKRRQIFAKYLHRAHEKLRKKRMLKAAERSCDAFREAMEHRDQDARVQLAMQVAIRAGKERAPIGVSKRPGTSRPIFFY